MLRGEDCRSNDRGELAGGRSMLRREVPRDSGAVRGPRSAPLIVPEAPPRAADGGRSPRSARPPIGRDSSRPRATVARCVGPFVRSPIPRKTLGGRSARSRSLGCIRGFSAPRDPRAAASGRFSRPAPRITFGPPTRISEPGLPLLPPSVPRPIADLVRDPAFGAGVARETTARSRTAAGGTRPALPAPNRLCIVGFTSTRPSTRARLSSLAGTRMDARPTARPFANTFRGTAVTAPAKRACAKFTLRMFPV
jgi:hypothetical protein